jgi:hypothetical protein
MSRSATIIGNYGGLKIPASGVYAGAEDQDADKNFTGPRGIETLLGRTMAIRRRHYAWEATYPTQFETLNAKAGIIPMVCQSGAGKFPSLASIVDGAYDPLFRAAAVGFRKLQTPVLFNLFYEFNGDHNPYFAGNQGGVGTELGKPGPGELAYQNAWRHIWGVFNTAKATIGNGGNVIFCWTQQGPTTAGFYQNYYPGDEYVDFIGFDLYRSTFASRCTNKGTFDGGTGSQDSYTFAGRHNKPYFIAEAGYRDGKSIVDEASAGGDGKAYDKDGRISGFSAITKLALDIKAHPNCVAYVHWNEMGNPQLSGSGNYVDTTPKSLAQYKAMYADPYFGLRHS